MQISKLDLLFKSGTPVVCVTAPLRERINVLEWISQNITAPKNLTLYVWNFGWGCFKEFKSDSQINNFYPVKSKRLQVSNDGAFAAFDCLLSYDGEGIFIFENLPSLIKETLPGYFGISSRIISQIINAFYELSICELSKYVILMTTDDIELPRSLCDLIPTLSTPLPEHKEIADFIQIFSAKFLGKLPGEFEISSLVHAASGLTIEEIRTGCALAFHDCQEINTQILASHLLSYKISRLSAFNLNFIPCPNVPDFGGLDLLKDFIKKAKLDFSQEARDANIPFPKGCLLVGPPGTGKTLAAQLSARELGFPLISIDTGAVAAGGANYLKRLLTRVEACAPAVLYFDEFDKLFTPRCTSEDNSNNKQILGTLLTWLQDKQSPVFVIATLNRLDALPPELTRVGRFDEIFYVGFPQAIERKEILMLHLARFDQRYSNDGNPLSEKEWRVILNKTVNCTGAELARMVEKAARCQFHQGREILIGLAELLEQREAMVPLYVRDTDRILAIENRARYFAQPSSSPDHSEYAPAITTFWGKHEST
ncbi:AAA ATPase central domain-containing protein (plasmid) [Fischerella sp. NIES-4106]|nr:AAA ATPase central domain-containing protein [Fischerella sp. NIES-4106]